MAEAEFAADFPGEDRDEKRLPKAGHESQQHPGRKPAQIFADEAEGSHALSQSEINPKGKVHSAIEFARRGSEHVTAEIGGFGQLSKVGVDKFCIDNDLVTGTIRRCER